MAYFDSIKIGGTIKQVQVVQELNALPSPVLETSPQLVKIGNDLYMRESKTGGLYGTYRFMLVPTNQQVYNVEFVSNGQTFGEIIINTSGEMAYNNTLVYSNGNWVNEAYKTIAIFDSNHNSGLVDFLNNNAEKIIDGYYKYIKVSSEGGSVVLEKDVSTTGGSLTFADDITIEEFDTLWNNEFIMLNILTGSTEMTAQVLLKKVRQGTAGATPVMSMVFTQVQPTNETTINYTELTISRDTSDDYISSEFNIYDITSGSPKIVDLNNFVPKTATQGTLERGALNVLQASNENYIVFNDEIYRLADKQHNAGYLVYSHNGHDTTGCFFQKCITITLSSRAWVLETQENQAKLTAGENVSIVNNVISAEAPITIVDALPEANEEEYNKHKLYLNGSSLKYIVGEKSEEPTVNVLTNANINKGVINGYVQIDRDVYLIPKSSGYIYSFNLDTKQFTQKVQYTYGANSIACAYGKYIFITGGSGTSTFKQVIRYDTENNTIQQMPNGTYSIGSDCKVAYDKKRNCYYMSTGSNSWNIYRLVFNENGYTEKLISSGSSSLYCKGSMAVVGDYLYIFGSTTYKSITKYNLLSNTYEILSVETLNEAPSSAIVFENKIVLCGGFDGTSRYNSIYVFDTTNDTIIKLNATLNVAQTLTFGFSDNNNIYCGFGWTGSEYTTTLNKITFDFVYQYKTITAE